jgi:hypothetical protein
MAMPSQTAGTFLESTNDGRSWRSIAVTGIDRLGARLGYPVQWEVGKIPPQVASVTLNGRHPASAFITVSAIKKQYGSAPPIFYTPYYTVDDGAAWKAVPIPEGFTQGEFAGFFTSGSTVDATWLKGTDVAVEVTDDGGKTWTRGSLARSANHLPLQFGPASDSYPGMGAVISQPVLRRQGNRWITSTTVDATVAAAPASQLDGLSRNNLLLINPSSAYQLELTQNDGRSWQYVSIPGVPGGPAQLLMMLHNGALLADGLNRWYLLSPHQTVWRPVPTSILPPGVQSIQQWGSTLWWYSDAPTTPQSAKLNVHQVGESRL